MDEVVKVDGPRPDWFRAEVEAVPPAPTAANRQKVLFALALLAGLLLERAFRPFMEEQGNR